MIELPWLLPILPKLLLFVFLVKDLFFILRNQMKPNVMSILHVLVAVITIVYLWFITDYGIEMTYKLFDKQGMAIDGYLSGLIVIPLGFYILKWLIHRIARYDKLKAPQKDVFNIFMSLIIYPLGSFYIFFLFYSLILIFL